MSASGNNSKDPKRGDDYMQKEEFYFITNVNIYLRAYYHITFCVQIFTASRTNIALLHPLLFKFETNQYQCSLLIEDRVMIISIFSHSPVRKPRAHL